MWNLTTNLTAGATVQVPKSASEFQQPRRILAEDHLTLRAGNIDLLKQL
jgi:hypothetical protein